MLLQQFMEFFVSDLSVKSDTNAIHGGKYIKKIFYFFLLSVFFSN